ncbi:MAG: carboxypeptidase-like regulatory domain-containing protein, partial [Bacteroidia bacterium]|nr:carboxypeptidase-like regulatory domain-containing protein [Bacteroidia bacterium]
MARYKIIWNCFWVLILFSGKLLAQNIVVKGVVLDHSTQEPLPGAVVKWGSAGSVCNEKGEFFISSTQSKN